MTIVSKRCGMAGYSTRLSAPFVGLALLFAVARTSVILERQPFLAGASLCGRRSDRGRFRVHGHAATSQFLVGRIE